MIHAKTILLFVLLVQSLFSQTSSITINMVGDIMLGSRTPHGFLPPSQAENILHSLTPILQRADLTIGNLEGVFCDSGRIAKCETDSLDCYAFAMPERYASYLKAAGFDMLSLANNHIGDFGRGCTRRTEAVLDSLGMGWSGERGSTETRTIRGVNVGFVAFHSGGYANSSLDSSAVREMIKKLQPRCDVIVVSVHGGGEGLAAMHLPDSMETYLGEPRGHLRKFARIAIDAGADLVFGHGPHVGRALEWYHQKLIAYSLGNFATYARFNLQEERRFGAILNVSVSPEGEVLSARIISTELTGWGVPELDSLHRFANLVNDLGTIDLGPHAAKVDSLGHISLP